MLSKHKVRTPMSGLLAVKRGFVAAILLIGLAAIAIGLAASAYAQQDVAEVSSVVVPNVPILRHPGVPEIAVGAGISAFVLAGGGLLLLADRLPGRRSRSPDFRFSGRRSCVEREWVGSQDEAKIGIATGGEIVHCIVSPPMIEPFERGLV